MTLKPHEHTTTQCLTRFLKKREQIWRGHPLTGEATPAQPARGEMTADTDALVGFMVAITVRATTTTGRTALWYWVHTGTAGPASSIWHSHPAGSPPQRPGCVVRCDSVQLPTSDHKKTTHLLLREKLDAISKYLQRGPTSPMWVTILEAAAPAQPSLHETATSWETLRL